jgi:hypothetical protein
VVDLSGHSRPSRSESVSPCLLGDPPTLSVESIPVAIVPGGSTSRDGEAAFALAPWRVGAVLVARFN